MKLVRPVTIDDSALASSSVSETDALYNAGTTYALAAIVRRDTTHRRYESLAGSNTGNTPEDHPEKWLDLGPTNRWAMFDQVNGTQTTATDTIAAELDIGGFADTIALLNISADSVQIVIETADDGEIYNQDHSLVLDDGITDWYAYFFEDVVRKADLIVTGLPNYLDPTFTVTLTDTGATVACGTLIVGRAQDLGGTKFGSQLGILDRSKKEDDGFGNYTIVERPYSDTGSFSLIIANTKVDATKRLLAGYRATPILWIGSDSFAASAIYGFYRSFSITIAYATESACEISIEGLS